MMTYWNPLKYTSTCIYLLDGNNWQIRWLWKREANFCTMWHSNGVPHLHRMAINKFSVLQIAVSCFCFILCRTCIEVDSLPLTIHQETQLEMKNEPLNRTDARSCVMLCVFGCVLLILTTAGAVFCVHVINTLDRQSAEINAMMVNGWCTLFFSRFG